MTCYREDVQLAAAILYKPGSIFLSIFISKKRDKPIFIKDFAYFYRIITYCIKMQDCIFSNMSFRGDNYFMDKFISVLITDDNAELVSIMKDYMSRYEDIRVVGIANDGFEAIEKIKQLMPDVVILDIIMPNLDGIGVLEKLHDMDPARRPIFLILSAIGQDSLIKKAIALGVEYFMVKPFDMEVLVARIRQFFRDRAPISYIKDIGKANDSSSVQHKQDGDSEIETANALKNMGILPNVTGYLFLKEAVIQTIKNRQMTLPITKVLYPNIAGKFDTTTQKVERAMRNAIDNAWLKGNIVKYFPVFAGNKPTNSEFIATLAERLKLEM
jgi:two-component system response regulator (stage 0 sporulation protein A)